MQITGRREERSSSKASSNLVKLRGAGAGKLFPGHLGGHAGFREIGGRGSLVQEMQQNYFALGHPADLPFSSEMVSFGTDGDRSSVLALTLCRAIHPG